MRMRGRASVVTRRLLRWPHALACGRRRVGPGTVHLHQREACLPVPRDMVPVGNSTTVLGTWMPNGDLGGFLQENSPREFAPPAGAGRALQALPSWGATSVA